MSKNPIIEDDCDEFQRTTPEPKPKPESKGSSIKDDPLLSIIMNDKIVDIVSTIISKLELIRFDEDRETVFKNSWTNDLFYSCAKRLGLPPSFNIDEWYNEILSKYADGRTDYRISPALANQGVKTNWLLPLFEIEIKYPGFIISLHNVMELEDKTMSKLASHAKEETEYKWIDTSQVSTPRLLGGPQAFNQKLIGGR